MAVVVSGDFAHQRADGATAEQTPDAPVDAPLDAPGGKSVDAAAPDPLNQEQQAALEEILRIRESAGQSLLRNTIFDDEANGNHFRDQLSETIRANRSPSSPRAAGPPDPRAVDSRIPDQDFPAGSGVDSSDDGASRLDARRVDSRDSDGAEQSDDAHPAGSSAQPAGQHEAESMVDRLRAQAAAIERVAADLESARQYSAADQLRVAAGELWKLARRIEPTARPAVSY